MASPARISTDSHGSEHSESERSSPSSSDRSTSAFLLVHERDVEEQSFEITDEDEDVPENNNLTPEAVLAPSIAFGYLLSPHLKLGAMLVLSSQAQLKVSLPALLVFSVLSMFSRQIWFLLARYVRKSDVGDIIAEAIARGRSPRKDGVRSVIRAVTHVGSGLVRILLAAVYLKGAISCMEPFWSKAVFHIPPFLALSVIFMLVVSPLTLAPSLSSRRLVYSTGLSNALYIAWLGVIVYAHATSALNTDNVMVPQGRLLDDITSVAFAFASLSNLQIYSGMVGHRGSSDKKEKRYLSISSISSTATLVGTGLILPVLFPSVKSHGDKEPTEDTSLLQALLATITALILVLAIPPRISASPPVPIPSSFRRLTKRSLGKYVLLILLFLLSLLPEALEPILEDAAVLLVLLSTYSLPALLHIIIHIIRRPTSILVDYSSSRSRAPPLLRPMSEDDDEDVNYGVPDRDTEELLLRKERALQRRRFGRRVMWDIGVWILLVPVGGGGMVWSVGRLVGAW